MNQTRGRDRLYFDDPQASGGGLQSQFGTVRTPFTQDVQNQLLAIQRPFQIDHFQVQFPLQNPGTPVGKGVFTFTCQRMCRGQISGRGDAVNPVVDILCSNTRRRFELFEDCSHLQSAMSFDNHGFSTSRRSLARMDKPGDFRNHSIANQVDPRGGGFRSRVRDCSLNHDELYPYGVMPTFKTQGLSLAESPGWFRDCQTVHADRDQVQARRVHPVVVEG